MGRKAVDPAALERLRVLDRLGEEISRAVEALYSQVAGSPDDGFHFPTGRRAAELAGYARDDLDALPPEVVARFAGVGCPLPRARLAPGERVLDLGCGAGTDVLLAARRVGPTGSVVGLDLTDGMVRAARAAVDAQRLPNVRIVQARAPDLSPAGGPFDVVVSNGALNLVPDKRTTLRRVHQLLRPGGRLAFADIALERPPSAACLSSASLWAECLVGAFTEEDYLAALAEAGFVDVEASDQRDYFATSSSEETRETARDLGGFAWVVTARRP